MGLSEIQLKNIINLFNDFDAARKLDDVGWERKRQELMTGVALLNQLDKGIRTKLDSLIMGVKYGKKMQKQLFRVGLMGDSIVIDIPIEQVEQQKLYCEDQNKEITRLKCKERVCSGEFFEQCKQCEESQITRRLLVNRD
jgi:hypothetical protein